MRSLSDLPPGVTARDIDPHADTLARRAARALAAERRPTKRTRVMNEGYYGLSSRVLDQQHRVTQKYLSRVIDIAAAYENGIMREDEAVMNLTAAQANYHAGMLPAQPTRRDYDPKLTHEPKLKERKPKVERPTEADRKAASDARRAGAKKGITSLVQMRWRLERERKARETMRLLTARDKRRARDSKAIAKLDRRRG